MGLPEPYWKAKGYKRYCREPKGRSIHTQNLWERAACEKLWKEGWKVYKRGWPDFVAVRGDEIQFIEIKPPTPKGSIPRRLDPEQEAMASILNRFFGIVVQVWNEYQQFGVEEFRNKMPTHKNPKRSKKIGYGEHLIKSHSSQKSLTETLPTQG